MVHHAVPQTCISRLEEKDILGRTEMSPVHFLYRRTVGNNAFHDRYTVANLSRGGEAVFIRLEGDGEAVVVRHADVRGAGLRTAPFGHEDFKWRRPFDAIRRIGHENFKADGIRFPLVAIGSFENDDVFACFHAREDGHAVA